MIHNVISASAHLTKDNEMESPSMFNRSEQKPSATCLASATKAGIIAISQFAPQNEAFSCAENVAASYQERFPDSSNVKMLHIHI